MMSAVSTRNFLQLVYCFVVAHAATYMSFPYASVSAVLALHEMSVFLLLCSSITQDLMKVFYSPIKVCNYAPSKTFGSSSQHEES